MPAGHKKLTTKNSLMASRSLKTHSSKTLLHFILAFFVYVSCGVLSLLANEDNVNKTLISDVLYHIFANVLKFDNICHLPTPFNKTAWCVQFASVFLTPVLPAGGALSLSAKLTTSLCYNKEVDCG